MASNEPSEQLSPLPGASVPPASAAERARLSQELAIDLLLCGVLLAGLVFLARHLQPDLPRLTFFTGAGGGGLCVLWAILGRCGTPNRLGVMVTLAAVGCVLARQAVQSWEASVEGGSKGRMVTALMTVLVVFCTGMLANLVQERKGVQP
jgi:FtsH-binding integral membrane protein